MRKIFIAMFILFCAVLCLLDIFFQADFIPSPPLHILLLSLFILPANVCTSIHKIHLITRGAHGFTPCSHLLLDTSHPGAVSPSSASHFASWFTHFFIRCGYSPWTRRQSIQYSHSLAQHLGEAFSILSRNCRLFIHK